MAHAAVTAAAKTDNMILFIRLFLLRLLRVSTALLKAPALQALGKLRVVKQPFYTAFTDLLFCVEPALWPLVL
jgi:hypothetical protein